MNNFQCLGECSERNPWKPRALHANKEWFRQHGADFASHSVQVDIWHGMKRDPVCHRIIGFFFSFLLNYFNTDDELQERWLVCELLLRG